MQTLRKIFKVTSIILLGFFTAFIVYANWEEPPLSDQLNLKPIALSVYNIDHDLTLEDSTHIANTLSNQKGITAATVNRIGKTISVTYHEDEISEANLKSLLASKDFTVSKVDFSAFEGPQCPVPSEYIDAVLNAKKALCFR